MTAVLESVLLATYVWAGTAGLGGAAQAAGGWVLSFFAVGCPVCNKLVGLAAGVSGALSYWAPVVQPGERRLCGWPSRRRWGRSSRSGWWGGTGRGAAGG